MHGLFSGHLRPPRNGSATNAAGGPAGAEPLPMLFSQGSQALLEQLTPPPRGPKARGIMPGGVRAGPFGTVTQSSRALKNYKGAGVDTTAPDPSRWVNVGFDTTGRGAGEPFVEQALTRGERYSTDATRPRGEQAAAILEHPQEAAKPPPAPLPGTLSKTAPRSAWKQWLAKADVGKSQGLTMTGDAAVNALPALTGGSKRTRALLDSDMDDHGGALAGAALAGAALAGAGCPTCGRCCSCPCRAGGAMAGAALAGATLNRRAPLMPSAALKKARGAALAGAALAGAGVAEPVPPAPPAPQPWQQPRQQPRQMPQYAPPPQPVVGGGVGGAGLAGAALAGAALAGAALKRKRTVDKTKDNDGNRRAALVRHLMNKHKISLGEASRMIVQKGIKYRKSEVGGDLYTGGSIQGAWLDPEENGTQEAAPEEGNAAA